MISGYDPRCEKCHHYPWTDFFINVHYPHHANPPFPCPCECHDTKREKKNMKFSIGGQNLRMYVEKLAICPFCKRSEFEDSVYYKIHKNQGKEFTSRNLGLSPRDRERFIGIELCNAEHEHDWTQCRCGRYTCKISFREYFGYDMDDELFDNTLVDHSHYSEEEKQVLDRDVFDWSGRGKINPNEIPVFHTMETVEKVWGKLPRDRDSNKWGNYQSDFFHKYQDEQTMPKTIRIFVMSGVIWTPEQLVEKAEAAKRYLDREEVLNVKGIGETTATKLFKKFKTADGVFSATEKQISKISGLSKRANFIWRCLDSYNKTREKKSE